MRNAELPFPVSGPAATVWQAGRTSPWWRSRTASALPCRSTGICARFRKRRRDMADLRCNFVGIRSPNPFWLASAPPTDKAYNVNRAFEAGWGGVVWKTLGEDPPIVNVTSRYGAMHLNDDKMIGFNNIELITDRPLDVNLREIKQVKRDWPDRAMVVSLMVPCEETAWSQILSRV